MGVPDWTTFYDWGAADLQLCYMVYTKNQQIRRYVIDNLQLICYEPLSTKKNKLNKKILSKCVIFFRSGQKNAMTLAR